MPDEKLTCFHYLTPWYQRKLERSQCLRPARFLLSLHGSTVDVPVCLRHSRKLIKLCFKSVRIDRRRKEFRGR